MKQQIKKYFKLILVLLLFIPLYLAPIVKADSGWDSSYDSGGSFGGGGSYGGGGSWDYDYDYGGSSGGGEIDDVFLLYFTVLIILILILCPKKIVKDKDDPNEYLRYEFMDITPQHLDEYLPLESIELLKQEMYLQFIEIQNAWMNFEYDRLRELCTDQLFNSYKTQLETLKLKNGQNIMHNFKYIDAKITNIEEINGEIVLTVFMCVEFYDYVINTETNKVIRGTNSNTILNNYIMTFVKGKDDKKKKGKKCPNCGAPNKSVTSTECSYCHSTLITKASRFVLSSKKNINE